MWGRPTAQSKATCISQTAFSYGLPLSTYVVLVADNVCSHSKKAQPDIPEPWRLAQHIALICAAVLLSIFIIILVGASFSDYDSIDPHLRKLFH